jgi:hypothetical protein
MGCGVRLLAVFCDDRKRRNTFWLYKRHHHVQHGYFNVLTLAGTGTGEQRRRHCLAAKIAIVLSATRVCGIFGRRDIGSAWM